MATRTYLYIKTAAPTVNDDTGDGYKVGDKWVDTTNDKVYTVVDVTAGAAVWKEYVTTGASPSDGWISQGSTWTYSSVDGATGIASVNSDLSSTLQHGMRLKYNQLLAMTAYWSFDTNSNSDVGSHNGTDTAMTYTAGKFSNAATFNGTTSKIVFTDHANFKPTSDFTIGFWVKTSTTGATQGLFQSYSANTAVAGVNIRIATTNVIRVIFGKNTGTTVNTDYHQFDGTTNVCDGTFHYVVVTFKNNYLQVYVDGILEISGYCFTPAYAATNYVRAGAINSTGADANFFTGQIDDLFLINGYALGEKNVRDKYIAATAQGTGSITVSKFGIITKVGMYASSATLITFWGGTDHSLTNATISDVYYSTAKAPLGFPINPDKWSVMIQDSSNASQSTPGSGTYYNLGSLSITIPIGRWRTYYNAISDTVVTTTAARVTTLSCGLSTATGSISDYDLRTTQIETLPILAGAQMRLNSSREKSLTLGSKTTYYLIQFVSCSDAPTSVAFRGDLATTVIRATSEYL